MNQYNKVEPYEYDFIREAFAEDWPVRAIAKKLERPMATIQAVIGKLSLHRPSHNLKVPKNDWPSIWYAYQVLGSYRQAGLATGFSAQAVRYAVSEMILMGSCKRLLKWNAYARLNGRDNYIEGEINVSDMVVHSEKESADESILSKLNISKQAISNRLRRGWSEERAISTPVMEKSERCRAGGIASSKGIAEAARKNGIPEQVVYRRIHLGWTLDRAASTPVRLRRKNK